MNSFTADKSRAESRYENVLNEQYNTLLKKLCNDGRIIMQKLSFLIFA